MPTTLDDLHKAEALILRYVPADKPISSAKLLGLVETGRSLDPDTVRYAYWTLVSDHRLERVPTGVRRGPEAPPAKRR